MHDNRTAQRYRRWYASILALYPRQHRERFGEGMTQTFNDLLREQAPDGRAARQAAWMFADTLTDIALVHLTAPSMKNTRYFMMLAGAASLLLIPVIGMQVSEGWQWTGFDFIFASVLLFGTVSLFELALRATGNVAFRAAATIGLIGTFLLVWVNGAVGIIGSNDEMPSALFILVPALGLITAGIGRFRAAGLSRALFAMAAAVLAIFAAAAVVPAWRPALSEEPGIIGTIVLVTFFVLTFGFAAMLFRRAARASASAGPSTK